MRSRNGVIIALAMVAITLSSCGSGGGEGSSSGSSASAPAPVPTPSPTASPTLTPAPIGAPLIAPELSAAPPLVFADAGGQSFAAPGAGVQLPLLLTAVSGNFGGDAGATRQGGTLDLLSAGSLTFSIPGLGGGYPITDGIYRSIGGPSALMSIANGTNNLKRLIWVVGALDQYSYGGTGIAGFVTRPALIPVAGEATSAGRMEGLVPAVYGELALLAGEATIDAAFATRTITGRIANASVAATPYYPAGPVNQMTFTATFDPARGLYVGEIVTQSAPGGPYGLEAGVLGTITLQYFGADGRDIGGVFVIGDGPTRAIGTLIASR